MIPREVGSEVNITREYNLQSIFSLVSFGWEWCSEGKKCCIPGQAAPNERRRPWGGELGGEDVGGKMRNYYSADHERHTGLS